MATQFSEMTRSQSSLRSSEHLCVFVGRPPGTCGGGQNAAFLLPGDVPASAPPLAGLAKEEEAGMEKKVVGDCRDALSPPHLLGSPLPFLIQGEQEEEKEPRRKWMN